MAAFDPKAEVLGRQLDGQPKDWLLAAYGP